MDYEKLHKDSLRIAQQLIDEGKLTVDDVKRILPDFVAETKDERIRKSLIKSFTNQHSSNFPTVDGFTREQIIAYLEKQKDEAQRQFNLGMQAGREEVMYEMEKEQKPVEWSKEDEAILSEIISFFRDGTIKLQHDLTLYANWLENRLKSFRPQPHWKPSEEQMEALNEAINEAADSDSMHLNSWRYNLLKEIKEKIK